MLKVIQALSKEWDMKIVAMRESKNLSYMSLHELFSDLKVYEFEMGKRKEARVTSTSTVIGLVVIEKRKPL